MDLNLLEYFVAVCRCGTISMAAEQLHISQPNLSNAMTRLEKELGVHLLERRRGKVAVTPVGRAFFEYSERSLNMATQGISRVKELSLEKYLAVVSNAQQLTSMMLAECWTENPDWHIQYEFCRARQCCDALLAGTAEVGILTDYELDGALNFLPVCTEEILVLVGKAHRLAHRQSLKMIELKDELFFCDDISMPVAQLNTLFAPAHFIPSIRVTSTEPTAVAALLDTGKGVGVIPTLIVPGYDERLKERFDMLRIEDYDCRRTVGIATRNNGILSPESREFCAFARAYLMRKSAESEKLVDDIYKKGHRGLHTLRPMEP